MGDETSCSLCSSFWLSFKGLSLSKHLFHVCSLLRVCQDLSVFQRKEFHLAVNFRLIKKSLLAAAFKVCKYIYTALGGHYCKFVAFQIGRSRSIPWATVAKIRCSDNV